MKYLLNAIVGLSILTTISCVHVGQRLLTIQIEVDGKVMFEGIRGVPDTMAVNDMWDVLSDVSFEARTDQAPSAELNGNVIVRIKHVDRELATAQLNTLSLQSDPSGSKWVIGKDESERIKQAAAQ